MPKGNKGRKEEGDGNLPIILVATPVVALLGTAVLHYTMQVFLQNNLWLRFIWIVWQPVYISIAVAGPPLLVALGIWYFIRRDEFVFWVVLYVTGLIWGFWYLIPPIVENWAEFMRFVEWFSKT